MEAEDERWREVAGRRTTAEPPTGTAMCRPIPLRKGAKLRAKPLAVLVKIVLHTRIPFVQLDRTASLIWRSWELR